MTHRIVIIQGHPDPAGGHLGHALADSYAAGAIHAGHDLRRIEVAQLSFPWLHRAQDWQEEPVPESLRAAQEAIRWADHVVIFFPLWLGTLPAILKAFLEQVLRPGFAFVHTGARFPQKGLGGKSARVVVTMGMPAFWYRWFFRAHGVRGLERSILGFCGIKPVRETFIGLVEAKDNRARTKWLEKMSQLGRKAD